MRRLRPRGGWAGVAEAARAAVQSGGAAVAAGGARADVARGSPEDAPPAIVLNNGDGKFQGLLAAQEHGLL